MPEDWRSFCSRSRPRRLFFCNEHASVKFGRRLRTWAVGAKIRSRAPRPTTLPTKIRVPHVSRGESQTFAKNTGTSDGNISPARTFGFDFEPITEGTTAGFSGFYRGSPSADGRKRQAHYSDSSVTTEFVGDGVRADGCR